MILSDSLLKELLLQTKTISEDDFKHLITFSKDIRASLYDAIIEKGILSDEVLGRLVADYFHIPFLVLSEISISKSTFLIVPERIARKHKIIAFEENKKEIKLATTNPQQDELVNLIAKKTSKKPSLFYVTERDLDRVMQMYQKDIQQTVDDLLRSSISNGGDAYAEAPVGKIVDAIITAAYRAKASDIHIEPEEENIVVRFRIDSILNEFLYLNKNLLDQIVTRIKVLSRLQTDEHLNPQDGKMRMNIDDEKLDIRVSILPIIEGEKIVMRLLSSRFRQFSLSDLGMSEGDLRKVASAVSKDYGLILSTGPTGSGKTTTIYSILKTLNTRQKNITTIEDPVEYRIKGVNQFQVNAKTKLSFANGLRSILRQDPNVIFVGEIRDNETASISVNAALTGHLVLSTLHTNDAATTLPRLIDMKVEPFLVASTVNLIIGQRLMRKICYGCKTAEVHKREELLLFLSEKVVSKYFGNAKKITLFTGKGCTLCHYSGYLGRIGIYELMEISETIKNLITQKKDSDVIKRQAITEGMTTMLDDGFSKVISGLTTIEEIMRVMKTDTL